MTKELNKQLNDWKVPYQQESTPFELVDNETSQAS